MVEIEVFFFLKKVEIEVGFDRLVREKGKIEKVTCEKEAEIEFLK
jgi:hypothetical protein